MELQYKESQDYKPETQIQDPAKAVLNIAGFFIFGGLLLQSITMPVSMDSQFRLYRIEDLIMTGKESLNYFLFCLICGMVYFLLVHMYFHSGNRKKAFFTTTLLLGSASIYMVFHLILHTASH
ncbi:hypothetical protein D3H55_16695 [Bacillus salacetis]|uniref:Uncharacterized protein n=1 Tax=Bacillus salacetis TaxID=2315464 RepID=A0A3A1QSM5_9BACI|nr:hypothetical protein [Bacillus salacetis]RIW30376.1 hypothetical protein D3H55_16695 [Bacillus salacetis]